jgi:hypothetical protein
VETGSGALAWAAIAIAIVGPTLTFLLGRRRQRTDERMVGYDQLQEDLSAARLRISQQDARIDAQDLRRLEDERRHAEESTRLDRRLRYAEGIVRHLNDEVDEVRALYRTARESGEWPPLPARQSWPAYPGEWQEAIK